MPRHETFDTLVTRPGAVLKAKYDGCTAPINRTITVEGTTYPYYVESGKFEFDGKDFRIRSVTIEFRINDDGSLFWKLFHIMVDDRDTSNAFYSLDEANWTPTDDPARFNVNIKGAIRGGKGNYAGVGGKMKMNGKARFTPECPSFHFDAKIKVKFE